MAGDKRDYSAYCTDNSTELESVVWIRASVSFDLSSIIRRIEKELNCQVLAVKNKGKGKGAWHKLK